MKNYTQQFEKTVLTFCKKGRLITPRVVIAVSGGLDSVALAFFASRLLEKKIIKSLTLIHINHQTRKSCAIEARFVKSLARKYKAYFQEYKIQNLELSDQSFEQKARSERLKIFQEVNHDFKTRVWCAHHIDDSFEWSLKQRLSSSVYRRQYGIPYKTPLIARPFMSVSKEQIKKYAIANKLKWKEDKSNLDTRFERGYLRQVVIPGIKARYPQYLKHYVRQMEIENSKYIFRAYNHSHHIQCWPAHSTPKQQIRKSIMHFSREKRGKLSDQIQKIERMLTVGKSGPMDMSGGVKVFNLSHELIITQSEYIVGFMAASFELAESATMNASELQSKLERPNATITDIWLALDNEQDIMSFRGGHPLLPMNLRNCCSAKDKVLVSSWKVLRHLMKKPTKKIKITSIVQID